MMALDCVLEQNILDHCIVCQAASRMYICHIYSLYNYNYIYIYLYTLYTPSDTPTPQRRDPARRWPTCCRAVVMVDLFYDVLQLMKMDKMGCDVFMKFMMCL